MSRNNNTGIRNGTLHFYHDSKGIFYTYLKTLELFRLEHLVKVSKRIAQFSKRTSVYLVETTENTPASVYSAGTYAIHGKKLVLIVEVKDEYKSKVQLISNLLPENVEMVWCNIAGDFRSKAFCTYIKDIDGYVMTIYSEPKADGINVLKSTANLSGSKKNVYVAWHSGMKKIAASSNLKISTNRFKPRELDSIIDTNGRCRDIKFHYVPDGFVKLKSQKRPI